MTVRMRSLMVPVSFSSSVLPSLGRSWVALLGASGRSGFLASGFWGSGAGWVDCAGAGVSGCCATELRQSTQATAQDEIRRCRKLLKLDPSSMMRGDDSRRFALNYDRMLINKFYQACLAGGANFTFGDIQHVWDGHSYPPLLLWF